MFTSTIDKTLDFSNGIAKVVPRQYPEWYGIKDIGFISLNEWSDPQIEYKGKQCSCYIVEDSMWERYKEDTGKEDYNDFAQYMMLNEDVVYELCEMALFGKEI